ncbi:SpoIIE family protein phosphatase [Caproiciproducens galactitolivorans]|uniref:Stage II sporulation protein E n=1 Tax=Caproiciproducens galactitolivorans TaxID=642589 RepID=A0A4Z0YDH7_9FIRM|nr:SpoIIE family protein phosphatase [Caproiciproducens galactitolivorans]QEY35742.1 SpoIIE family protein phosphatase [Caproiciproducens galactitolivorans]TGJ77475.1 stage II sporulation protein E [Caproiciproducens galactitolivorans]
MIKAKTERISFPAVAADPTKAVARQLVYFTAALLCSRGLVFGHYAPFGVAAVAAFPYAGLWSAVLGSAAGYLLPSSVNVPVHYLAAVLAAAAIRWTLNDMMKLKMHAIFAPMVAFLPMLATAMAIIFVNGSGSEAVAMYIAEAFLAGGVAYFFTRTSEVIIAGRSADEMNAQEITCAALSVGALLLPLSNLAIGPVSLGRVLAVIAVLFAAYYGGVSGGSVTGIAAGIVFSLSTSGLNYLSGAYALGGLMAGVFSPVGRLASVVAFIISNAVASLQVGNQEKVIGGLYEVMVATVLYMLIPQKAGAPMIGLFSCPDDTSRMDGLRRSVIMKLDYAAKALGSVSDSVEEVSKKLYSTCAPDINGVYKRTIDDVCSNCGLKVYCWERNYNDSMNSFNDLTEKLRSKGEVDRNDFNAQFASHCSRLAAIADSVNSHYREFSIKDAAESRAQQVRSMVADQFATTSNLLEDMAAELELYEQFDFNAAQKVGEVLRGAGILPIDISCRVDRFDRMSIEIIAAQAESVRMNKAELTDEISRVCGRVFQHPCVSVVKGKCRLQMAERPFFRVQTGCAQHTCANKQVCGDSWDCFPDGNGRQILLISDGMGTGGRAAVDGAMATGILSRLIKAGIGFDAALKIVNSALMVKSGDESLATIDLAALDLFNGNLEFMKAGAPISILRKSGRAVVIDAPSLPIGILNDINFTKSSDSLGDGDLLVLLSDGALAAGDDWICDTVEKWKGQVPQELAEEIVTQAIARRADGHDDDITVLVMKVKESDSSF